MIFPDISKFYENVLVTDLGFIFGPCYIWIGPMCREYGRNNVGSKRFLAHRTSFFIHNGFIDPDKHIDHICCNTRCIHPRHLQQVEPKRNQELKALRSKETIDMDEFWRGYIHSNSYFEKSYPYNNS